MKEKICILLGLIGGAISAAFGGWSGAMTTLLLCMAIDYLSGLIVAGVFHKSRKSATGALDSFAGWKGLCRKGMTLLIQTIHRVQHINASLRILWVLMTMTDKCPNFTKDTSTPLRESYGEYQNVFKAGIPRAI